MVFLWVYVITSGTEHNKVQQKKKKQLTLFLHAVMLLLSISIENEDFNQTQVTSFFVFNM